MPQITQPLYLSLTVAVAMVKLDNPVSVKQALGCRLRLLDCAYPILYVFTNVDNLYIKSGKIFKLCLKSHSMPQLS